MSNHEQTALACAVGLEEGADGAAIVHALSVPGCVSAGATRDEALERFPEALAEWLTLAGEQAPEGELEIAVNEWISSEAEVAAGESHACFDADLEPLTDAEISSQLRSLGDLRGLLLKRLKRTPDASLDEYRSGDWTVRQMAEELARGQWWLLTRLGSSPLGEISDRTLGRLDTAMALVVHRFSTLPAESRGLVLEMDDEVWTPRKVLRRLLALEHSIGRSALLALGPDE